ncbi:MAG: diaminopimelate decarboxylase [Anaerolineae bacterium]|nr:diaminopimelate decarboxylase [Anaerolineae bacterium]MDW8173052.1 diaminopimelate decarboxylase [Anaerolineae bacterium]
MALHELMHVKPAGLMIEGVAAHQLAQTLGTPLYVYSLGRLRANLRRLRAAFEPLSQVEIHYSAKANANLSILRAVLAEGAGIDAVSGGEIFRALSAGADPRAIVYAGAGKTVEEIAYAVEQGIGWFNVENLAELGHLEREAARLGRRVRVALRLNPEVTANTHPYIATGHGGAKFGLTSDAIRQALAEQSRYPHLDFMGLHVHIGSQLGDIGGTVQAVERALELAAPYESLKTVNIGGGFPVPYGPDEQLPAFDAFAQALAPLLRGYRVLLEPGRSIVADIGLLLTRVLYTKYQGGQTIVIVDASMTELIRPALYGAKHAILPLSDLSARGSVQSTQVVGPVCETADVLGRDVPLPPLHEGDLLAILTSGAYGMVMASHYNARPKPAEVVVEGDTWRVARSRERWQDLIAGE